MPAFLLLADEILLGLLDRRIDVFRRRSASGGRKQQAEDQDRYDVRRNRRESNRMVKLSPDANDTLMIMFQTAGITSGSMTLNSSRGNPGLAG